MDTIGDLLIQFASLMGAVWGGTEMIPRAIPAARNLKKDALALILGPVFGLAAAGLGWVVLPGEPTGVKLYLGGAVAGWFTTMAAGIVHDKTVKAVSGGVKK